MSPIALWGFLTTQGPGVICNAVFHWLLLYLLTAGDLARCWAVPSETVLQRLAESDTPHNVGKDLRGRAVHSGRSQREVRLPREDRANVTGEPVDISTATTAFVDVMNFTTELTNSSTLTTEAPGDDGAGVGMGTIVGGFFGALLGCAIIGGALYLLIRYKRAQAAEYNRSVQVHMSSTRNAGVYVDLAEPADMGGQGRDYTSLKQQNNGKKDRLMQSDLYEYDSDDEVCVYN